tara:strand:+ start:253 stop:480 length:228 start_codon:yes stop_codon:yes gene_type:complete
LVAISLFAEVRPAAPRQFVIVIVFAVTVGKLLKTSTNPAVGILESINKLLDIFNALNAVKLGQLIKKLVYIVAEL